MYGERLEGKTTYMPRSPIRVFVAEDHPLYREGVVRAIKEVGWSGFSAFSALSPMVSMGQELFDPPSVGVRELFGTLRAFNVSLA